MYVYIYTYICVHLYIYIYIQRHTECSVTCRAKSCSCSGSSSKPFFFTIKIKGVNLEQRWKKNEECKLRTALESTLIYVYNRLQHTTIHYFYYCREEIM